MTRLPAYTDLNMVSRTPAFSAIINFVKLDEMYLGVGVAKKI